MVFVTHSIDEAVLMGDRIVILGGQPGQVRDIVDVGIGRPRDRRVLDSERFRVVRDYVWTAVMASPAGPDRPGDAQTPAGDRHQAGSRKEQG
jgi:ABC-type nitrate/sulfonate/bicarbonate transport system ATPase subunit